MRTPLLIFVSMMLCGAVHADTIDVPEDYPTIQDAIGAASNGDTIAIAAGTYFEHDVNAYGKELIITGRHQRKWHAGDNHRCTATGTRACCLGR